jgi:hypothetical protein
MNFARVRGCEPARFARLCAALPAGPVLFVAELAGELVTLGRHQRAASALPPGTPAARRLGGGRAFVAGSGTVALAFRGEPPVPGALLLNRRVRPLLGALRALRVATPAYFGRDVVVAGAGERRSVACVSQDEDLFEAWVAATRSPAAPSAYPPHGDPKQPGPPFAAIDRPAGELADALVAAYGAGDELAVVDGGEPGPPALERDDGWTAGPLVEVPIGFVEAQVRMVGGRIAACRLRGDFIWSASAREGLEASLVGCAPTFEEIAARVDAAVESSYLHGVPRARALADAILRAR